MTVGGMLEGSGCDVRSRCRNVASDDRTGNQSLQTQLIPPPVRLPAELPVMVL